MRVFLVSICLLVFCRVSFFAVHLLTPQLEGNGSILGECCSLARVDLVVSPPQLVFAPNYSASSASVAAKISRELVM